MPAGEEIVDMVKSINRTPERRTDCEQCGWTLNEHPAKGLHCPLCGWTENIYQRKRIDEFNL